MTVNYLLQTIAARIALLCRNIFRSLPTFPANKKLWLFILLPTIRSFFFINFFLLVKICLVGIILNCNDCSETVNKVAVSNVSTYDHHGCTKPSTFRQPRHHKKLDSILQVDSFSFSKVILYFPWEELLNALKCGTVYFSCYYSVQNFFSKYLKLE
jgi:hypothetical protein